MPAFEFTMRKRPVSVEWHVAENEEEWHALRHERERALVQAKGTSLLRWFTSLVCIGLVSLGLWQWQRQPVTPVDSTPVAVGDSTAATPPVGHKVADVTALSNSAVAVVERGGPFTNDIARMLERPEWGIHAYQTVDESLQEILAGGLWGREETLESAHFAFHYRQRDAQTIAESAPMLDQIYEELWQSWGVPTASHPKIVVQVSERYLQSDLPYLPQRFAQLIVSSPALYPALPPWTTNDLFVQSVVVVLVDQLLAEAVDFYAIGTARDPVLKGLQLWQIWDLALPLAEQQEQVRHWLYAELPGWQPGTELPVPDTYARLCTVHKLWMVYPAQLQIPLLCDEQDRSPLRFAPQVVQHPPTTLPWLNARHYTDEEADGLLRLRDDHHPGETVALALLIDYLVRSQGRAKLPDLLANLSRYRTWDDLLLAVYGVPAAQVEAGWRQRLTS